MANKFKVIALNRLSSGPLVKEQRELSKLNAEVELTEIRCASEDELIALAKDADLILGGGRFFTRRVLESLPKCRAIITYSVGFDGVDVDAATECGIVVVNNPAVAWCVEEVSNHTIALLLACAKKLTILNDLVKQGRWGESRRVMAPMPSVWGQTLGIIGCGNIGRATARKAQVFGLRLLGYDPYVNKALAAEYGITLVSLPKLLRESDFVTLHTPLDKQTRHMIGEAELKLMKPTAYLINTARGAIIDEPALIRALQEKRIAGAGLDVFEKEPIDPTNPLLKLDN
ncbi:MAG: C-terminal binding protein, partial [Chloroflexi bacterium]|nr:C-terminal binding protein [Chloroflexota bacterium]